MTEAQIALARRAVAAPGWRWLPGMLLIDDDGIPVRFVVELGTHALGVVQGGGHPAWRKPLPIVAFPVLTDAATLGCLLALVRERWKMPHLTVTRKNRWWTYRECAGVGLELHRICAPTETEALIAALEVAP